MSDALDARTSLMLAGLLATVFMACDGDSPSRRLGEACASDRQCESELCGGTTCLDPGGDNDFDGLSNSLEKAVGSDPVVNDTDADGLLDGDEIGAWQRPTDTDGDGKPDIIESATRDDDGDCITNQYDADDARPDGDRSPMVPVVCRQAGVCADPGVRLGVVCDDAGTARCAYDGVPGWQPSESVCDRLDEDCDGETDEGLCPAEMDALVVSPSLALPLGGMTSLEARGRRVDGTEMALGDALVLWTLLPGGEPTPVEIEADIGTPSILTIRALGVGLVTVQARLGTFDAEVEVSVLPPTCSDGVQNGEETGLDCGGGCSYCDDHPCARGVCGQNGVCDAEGDAFRCVCDPGFAVPDGFTACVDIDECDQSPGRCGQNASCQNTPGAFDCICEVGFGRDESGTCSDIDECSLDSTVCGINARCENRLGTFDCICEDGFEVGVGGSCIDVDECQLLSTRCGPNARCDNTPGSFDCVCDEGFGLDELGTCADIDECRVGNPCDEDARCENLSGGFACTCNEGFESDGNGGCSPLACWNGSGVIDPGCTASSPICAVEAGRVCIACRENMDCVEHPDGSVCDQGVNSCVACIATAAAVDPGCEAAEPVCDTRRGNVCVRCLEDGDCVGAPEGALCDDDGSRCVECFDTSDCPWRAYGDVCNIAAGTCALGPTFVSRWDSRIVLGLDAEGLPVSPGESPAGQIALPLVEEGVYDFLVEWGDGSFDIITAWDDPGARHTYASPGIHEVRIRGTLQGWRFAGAGDRGRLLEVSEWGALRLGPGGRHFEGALNMDVTATDILALDATPSLLQTFKDCASLRDLPGASVWDTSAVTNLRETFSGASRFEGDISGWDTSQVTTLALTFSGAALFNADISEWDIGNVVTLESTFSGARAFNRPIEGWNTSRVTSLSGTFAGAVLFDQPIGGWDTSEVRSLNRTFEGALAFNQPLDTWNTSKVTSMAATFRFARTFDQPLGNWDTRAVTNMYGTFQGATVFNQPLATWDVGNVTIMSFMFAGALAFNRDLDAWDVSDVREMLSMFNGAASFNGEIGGWDVRQVVRMTATFSGALAFNRDISAWQPVSATSMERMFEGAASFNQPIGRWNVSTVENMAGMFRTAQAFNQPLDSWNVGAVTSMARMFLNAVRFNQPLPSWDTRNVTSMSEIFASAFAFAGDVSTWNTARVTDMRGAFRSALAFNGDLSAWDTGAVTDMGEMFAGASVFNGDIEGWNVSRVTRMDSMFAGSTRFSRNLGSWNVSQVTDFESFLGEVSLTTPDYDALMNGWVSRGGLKAGLTFDGGGSRFSSAGAAARSTLVDVYGWRMNDGGLAP